MRFGPSHSHSRRRSTRRGWIVALALGLAGVACGAGSAGAKDVLTVTMDQAKLIKFPPNTETIIIGNPIIADVTMLKASGILVVTAKSYGETNLVLLDHGGTVLSEAALRVEPSDTLLVVQRGTDRESYSCHPRCEPSVSIGDASSFLSTTATSITTRNGLATPGGGSAAPAAPH